MNIAQMLYIKQQLGYSYDKIAELSGIPKGTVQKILSGVTKSPRYETLQALESVFSEGLDMQQFKGNLRESSVYGSPFAPDYVHGTSARKIKQQGEFTLEDYFAIPDDRRVELIDGVIYDQASPTADHQLIGFQICYQIENYIDAKDGACIPFVAPCDVQICCDNFNMVQPDVFILCDKKKYRYQRIYGAPEFIAEILSKSTSRHDRQRKYIKYYEAGVKEYWIVDPFKEQVTVYLFDQSLEGDKERGDETEIRKIYSFDDQVPVGIYDNDLKIDFTRIKKRLMQLQNL